MFKSILFLSALLGVQTMPVYNDDQYVGQQERQYQHTEDVGNTEVTYKFESNEVSNIDDLVEGNVYSCDLFNFTSSVDVLICKASFVYGFTNTESATLELDVFNADYFRIRFLYLNNYIEVAPYRNNSAVNWFYLKNTSFVFQYLSDFNNNVISYVSYTDYNDIISVEYVAPTSIFGHLSEVLGDNLYGGIPNVDNVIFSIGGQDITLKSWLVTTTCIVLAVVLITILCLFIRWLFKLFSNTILLR